MMQIKKRSTAPKLRRRLTRSRCRRRGRKSIHGLTLERMSAHVDFATISFAYCRLDCIKTIVAMIHRASDVVDKGAYFTDKKI